MNDENKATISLLAKMFDTCTQKWIKRGFF